MSQEYLFKPEMKKPFVCTACHGKRFGSIGALKQHITVIHNRLYVR